MVPAHVQYYVHPLALDAKRFLISLEYYRQIPQYNQIDPTLCNLLRDISFSIENFLDQKPQQVVASETVKLVQPSEFPTVCSLYHCDNCKQDLGKSAEKAARHLVEKSQCKSPKEVRQAGRESKKQVEERYRETKLIKLPKKAKAIIMSDMAKFFADQLQVAEKLKQIPEYKIIEDTLSTMLKKVFPDKSIKLYKFGSRMTGIGTRNSDLDIYIEIGDQFNVFEQSASQDTLNNFDRILEMVKRSTIDWDHVRPIRGARVPIIRMTSRKTNIECDIGFSNSLSYCNTQLLQYVFQQQPIGQDHLLQLFVSEYFMERLWECTLQKRNKLVSHLVKARVGDPQKCSNMTKMEHIMYRFLQPRRLCIFMKKWLERTRLNERITTYCMSLMVIYYLQIKNLLPSIHTLQEKMLANLLVGPWIGNFIEVPLTDLNMQVLSVSPPYCKQHIKEFCQFYARFNYETQVVCPYIGCPIIESKNVESLMPERYKNFVKNDTSPKDCGLQLNTPMCVQDPLQMNHNVAARVTKADLKEWKDYLAQSAAILAELK